MKKSIIFILVVFLIGIFPMTPFAAANDEQPISLEQIAKQNGMTVEQYNAFCEKQKQLANDLAKQGDKIFKTEQEEMQKIKKENIEKFKAVYPKEATPAAKNKLFASTLGTIGDILVTYTGSSSGIDVAIVGHAAVVSTNISQTVESFPEKKDKNGKVIIKNGVQKYTNDWANRSKVYGVRVKKATTAQCTAAAKYAEKQISKPYNWNFVWKYDTNKFYCSQLAWRSWNQQGYEVDRMPYDTIVSPAELVGASSTYSFYYKG